MLFPDMLKSALKSNFDVANDGSGGRNVVIRCMYCGDSDNPRSAHLSINLGYNNTPVIFNCFKCRIGSGNLLTREIAISWGLYDEELLVALHNHNRNADYSAVSYGSGGLSKLSMRAVTLKNNFIRDNDLSKRKLDYINRRLDTCLDYNDMVNCKIVLNLKDLLQANNIYNYTRDSNIVEELDKHFLGFISNDNGYINLRKMDNEKVHSSIDKRYVLYRISDRYGGAEKYYTIPTNVKLDSMKPVFINISEGPFDILSVLYNVNNGNRQNMIYSAVNGSSYYTPFKNFITKHGIINMEVHLYKDNDNKGHGLDKLHDKLKPLYIPLYVHNNNYPDEKDFGVRKSNIIDNSIKLI